MCVTLGGVMPGIVVECAHMIAMSEPNVLAGPRQQSAWRHGHVQQFKLHSMQGVTWDHCAAYVIVSVLANCFQDAQV